MNNPQVLLLAFLLAFLALLGRTDASSPGFPANPSNEFAAEPIASDSSSSSHANRAKHGHGHGHGHDIKRYQPGPRLSQAVIHNGIVYCSGVVPTNWQTNNNVTEQTSDILKQIDAILEANGSSKGRILTMQIFLKDIKDFNAMNAGYDAWLDKANPPARATTEAALAAPDILVEIMVTAAQGKSNM